MAKLKVLFLCTGNACRSQMAEGWARHLKADVIDAHSAGTHPKGVDPMAIEVMRKAGVDIASHASKNVADLVQVPFDFVVTVCDSASEACPVFPGATKVIHRGFDDPPALARGVTDAEARRRIYRRVRDEIRVFVETLPQGLTVSLHNG